MRHLDKEVMQQNGWLVATSRDDTPLWGVRASPWPGAYVKQIAGIRAVKRDKEFPLKYAIFQGDEPRREEWESTGLTHDQDAQRELLEKGNPAKNKTARCGMHVVRICSFHLNTAYATESPSLCGEMLCSMVADCFHYQVDIIGGDGSSAA